MLECISLKITPSYESDFFFVVNFKQHFKPNGSRIFFAQKLFYTVVFVLLSASLLPPVSLYVVGGFVSPFKIFYDTQANKGASLLMFLSAKSEIHAFKVFIRIPLGISPPFTANF